MKIKRVISIIVILGIVFSITITAVAENNRKDALKYKDMRTDKIKASLNHMSKNDLLNEVEATLSQIPDSEIDEIIPFAVVFNERINEYSENDVIQSIKKSSNGELYKVTAVQSYCKSYNKKTQKGKKNLMEMLFDEDVEVSIKENIIIGLEFEDEYEQSILETIVEESNDLLAFQALKKMNQKDKTKAVEISKSIIYNYKNEKPEKLSASIKVLAEKFRKNRINNNWNQETLTVKKDFINIAYKIIKDNTKTEKLKDSAIFALSDMTDFEAIKKILQSSEIENSYKIYAIDQNCYTIAECINNELDLEDINLICDAMMIYPLDICYDALGNVLKNCTDLNTKDKINKALENIEKYGNETNEKWESFYFDEGGENND